MKGEVIGSMISAFVIGASASFGVGMLFSGGKVNWQGLAGVIAAGAVAASKDYRSLMKLPPVSSGNTEVINKQ
jgi:hypothetical protein